MMVSGLQIWQPDVEHIRPFDGKTFIATWNGGFVQCKSLCLSTDCQVFGKSCRSVLRDDVSQSVQQLKHLTDNIKSQTLLTLRRAERKSKDTSRIVR